MAFESIAAAQDCREYLGIKGNTYVTVNGYVDGNPHNVTILSDYDKVIFSFESAICGYQYFDSRFQKMEWDEEECTLTISSDKQNYSFEVHFPEQY
ncbi:MULTISPECIES: hypothetical protein [Kosakonia]|uniref:hypothetical protein n=1 Tax=Kosakonia TaxID=1330547 RepID=UPI001904AF33|nr:MULTISPECIES: hypothetical protein [Kosakonia]MBK0015171.1 hypothetical protein [Kosakonia sp. S42]MBK0077978.1 hypothetical protein [Kosakonia sp. S57]MBK0084956.1 hypothetical protein [Kosakonia sp. S58]UGS44499.1 hypothetical protein JMT66_14115 [Kosakonia cowanii]